jgi:hypothetical protein
VTLRNPTLTFAWLSWRQFGRELTLSAIILAFAGVASATVPQANLPVPVPLWVGVFEWAVVVVAAVLCIVSTLAYADLQFDVLARESGFPKNLLRLPVRTGALIIWPMLFGTLMPAALWIVVSVLILHPWERGRIPAELLIPVWWPAALATASVTFLQALLWLPVGLRGMRLALIVLIAAVVIYLAVAMSMNHIAEPIRFAVFMLLAACSWGVAYTGVRLARHGSTPDWNWLVQPWTRIWLRPETSIREFLTAKQANDWLLWRISGRALPVMVGLILVILFANWLFNPSRVSWTPEFVFWSLVLPPILAGFTGGWGIGAMNRTAKHTIALSPWIACMPISNSERLKGLMMTSLKSALWAFALVGPFVALTILAAIISQDRDSIRRMMFNRIDDPAKVIAFWIAIAFLLAVWTWKRSLNSCLMGFRGRVWIIGETSLWIIAYVVLLVVGSFVGPRSRMSNPQLVEQVVFGGLIALRLTLAALAIVLCLERGLVRGRTVILAVGIWLVLIASIIGTLRWTFLIADGEEWVIWLGVLTVFPIGRLAASPLILERSRHQ